MRAIPCEPVSPLSNPTSINLTSSIAVPVTARYILRVTAAAGGWQLTARSGMSNLVQNEGANAFDVVPVGGSYFSLAPGQEAMLTWDASQNKHEVQVQPLGGSVTVDTALSTTSTNPVQNKVVTAALNLVVPNYDFLIVGTDNVSDNSAVATLVAAINASTKAVRVAVDGIVGITGLHYIDNTHGVEFVARRPGAGFNVKAQGAGFVIGDPGSFSPIVGATAISTTAAFAESIPNPISLVIGDWFVVSSVDPIPGVLVEAGYIHCPAEMHQVRDLDGGNVVFDDFIVDALTATPLIRKVPMRNFFYCSGLTFRCDLAETVKPTANLFYLRCVRHVRFLDNTWLTLAPNGVFVNMCGFVHVDGNTWERLNQEEIDPGYNVITGLVTKARITNNLSKGHRHFFTTSAVVQDNSLLRLYGTPRNVLLQGNVCSTNGPGFTTMSTFDTHCNGWGISFIGNHTSMPSESGRNNQAFKIRSRHTHVIGNTIDCGGANIGIDLFSSDNEVSGNRIKNATWGVAIGRAFGSSLTVGGAELTTAPDGNRIHGSNRFDKCTLGVHVMRGDNTHVIGNTFANGQGTLVSFNDFSSILSTPGGTDNRVANNDMAKGPSHTFAVDGGNLNTSSLKIVGNNLDGYGANLCGINQAPTSGPGLHTAALAKNWHD